MSLVRRIAAIPKPLLTILALVFVAALWVLDYVTGPDLSPLIFYVVPVVLVVWFAGRRPGVLVSIVAAFAWFLADYLTGRHERLSPAILYWNGVEKLLFFLLLVQLLATLKSALERERHARQEFLEREVRIAEQVQERLFPQRAPRMETLECAGVCRPARGVGGDYYDFLPLEDGRLGIAVGDVSGKGLSAALLMASLQGSLRSLAAADGARVDEIVGDVNRQLCSLTEANRFVTLFFGIYDDHRRELSCVNAGHNAPMLLRAGPAGASPERLRSGGTVLGFFPEAGWRAQSLSLAPGDVLVAVTDGVVEATNAANEEFGERRLAEVLVASRSLPADELCREVLARVAAFLAGLPAADDLTVVVARVLPPRRG
ncbi:MAG TPA: PP2C family protein-serine/threonine phosphatase [Thermoanaerobaculia bacterium]|nr:PP2C family protein-serine/threonine phosphatase [Thermoanaerobaculia bacterium]